MRRADLANRLSGLALWAPRRLARRLGEDGRLAARTTWHLVRPHWRLAALAFTANVAAAAFEGGAMALFALAIQTVLGGGATSLGDALGGLGRLADRALGGLGRDGIFLALVSLAVAAVVLRSACQLGGRVASAYLEVLVFKGVWNGVFRQFMTMSYAQISRHKTGDLNQYVWDAKAMSGLLWHLNMVLGGLLIVLVYIAILLWLSWPLALVAVLALVALAGSLASVMGRVRASAEAFLPARVEMGARSLEFLSGMRVVRTLARERYATAHVAVAVDEAMLQTRRRSVWLATINPVMQSATAVGVALFLLFGYLFMGQTGQSAVFPRLVTFLAVLYRLLPLAGEINNERAMIIDLAPLIRRVNKMLRSDDKEYTKDGVKPFIELHASIEFRRVSLRYIEGERAAANDLSFVIPRGTMTALVGESGAGKSSVVDLLLRLYDPTDGQILIDGVDLREFRLSQWRERLGVVAQDTFIFNASVRENIAIGRLEATEAEIVAAAQAAGAHDFITQLVSGYDTMVGDRGYRLSGGQRQRIAIARAVLRRPDILVLDEATSSLDSQSERAILEAIEGLRVGHTVLAVAHRLSTVAMADQILVLKDGRLIERGTHQELLATNGLYARLWSIQTRSADQGDGVSAVAAPGGISVGTER